MYLWGAVNGFLQCNVHSIYFGVSYPFKSMAEFVQYLITFLVGSFATLGGVVIRSNIDEKRNLDEECHRPLYNETTQVITEGILEGLTKETGRPVTLRSKWWYFDHYLKSKVDSSLRSRLEEYDRQIRRQNRLLEEVQDTGDVGLEELLNESEQKRLFEFIEQEFPEDIISIESTDKVEDHPWIDVSGHKWPVLRFLNLVGPLMLSAENEEELEIYMESGGETEIYGNRFASRVEFEYPEWISTLWKLRGQLPETVAQHQKERIESYKESRRQCEVIEDTANQLRGALDIRIHSTYLYVISPRLLDFLT